LHLERVEGAVKTSEAEQFHAEFFCVEDEQHRTDNQR
jgi:hypothetical protein